MRNGSLFAAVASLALIGSSCTGNATNNPSSAHATSASSSALPDDKRWGDPKFREEIRKNTRHWLEMIETKVAKPRSYPASFYGRLAGLEAMLSNPEQFELSPPLVLAATTGSYMDEKPYIELYAIAGGRDVCEVRFLAIGPDDVRLDLRYDLGVREKRPEYVHIITLPAVDGDWKDYAGGTGNNPQAVQLDETRLKVPLTRLRSLAVSVVDSRGRQSDYVDALHYDYPHM